METVGSALRFEPTSVEDPVSNAAASYRVVANVTETVDPDGAQITSGITHGALFHGPTLMYGINGTGHAVALHNNSIPGVFNIMYTNSTGVIVDNNPLVPPLTVSDSQTGNFVMMAGEKDIGYFNNSRVIGSGASPYGDYEPMWQTLYYGTNMNGSTLVKQAILWGLEATPVVVPGPPSIPTLSGPSSINDGTIELSWTASTDDSAVDHYQVQVSNASNFGTILIDINKTTLSHTADVTTYGEGMYYSRVQAFDDLDNPSGWSNVITTDYSIATTPPPPPIPGFPFEAIFLALAAVIVPVLIIRRRRK